MAWPLNFKVDWALKTTVHLNISSEAEGYDYLTHSSPAAHK